MSGADHASENELEGKTAAAMSARAICKARGRTRRTHSEQQRIARRGIRAVAQDEASVTPEQ